MITRKAMCAHILRPRPIRKAAVCALLLVAGTTHAAGAPSHLPALEPVEIEVDTSALPASEQAALVPLIRAARQLDALYMRQVWPDTRALVRERRAARTPAAEAELAALDFFK